MLVVGAGLIGTSVALTLRARGHTVVLDDQDPDRLRRAEQLGAGGGRTDEPLDLAVVAVPPSSVANVVLTTLRASADCTVCDTASVKERPLRELEAMLAGAHETHARLMLSRFVGGHPIAGRQTSGPESAEAGLFAGGPWVLTPVGWTSGRALDDARWLVEECGAVPVVMTPHEHDQAVAFTSHLPQLVASALAAQLLGRPESALRAAGPGLLDMTRIAGSDPDLWTDIALSNAPALADALDELRGSLANAARALRGESPETALKQLFEAGNKGRVRVVSRS